MTLAKHGDTVQVHYTGSLADGTVFDSSRERQPLEFTLGEGQVIPGFDQAVLGMQHGESKQVVILADDAYGQYQDDMVFEVDREQLPPNFTPTLGEQYQIQQGDGTPMVVTVSEISPDAVTLDANHPLAGYDLTFDLELVGIE